MHAEPDDGLADLVDITQGQSSSDESDEDGDTGEGPSLAADGKPYTTLGYGNGPGAIKPGGREMPETGVAAHQQAAIPTGSETHGGEDVALYANGPGAQNVRGVMEQNLIYDVIRKAFGWAD